jgi:hypothetical protein
LSGIGLRTVEDGMEKTMKEEMRAQGRRRLILSEFANGMAWQTKLGRATRAYRSEGAQKMCEKDWLKVLVGQPMTERSDGAAAQVTNWHGF